MWTTLKLILFLLVSAILLAGLLLLSPLGLLHRGLVRLQRGLEP